MTYPYAAFLPNWASRVLPLLPALPFQLVLPGFPPRLSETSTQTSLLSFASSHCSASKRNLPDPTDPMKFFTISSPQIHLFSSLDPLLIDDI